MRISVSVALLACAVCAAELPAQTSRGWQLGVGAAYGDELKLRGSLLLSADLSRQLLVTHGLGIAIGAEAGYAPQESAVACPVSAVTSGPVFEPCDLRYLARLATTSLGIDARYAHPGWPVYLRTGAGPWWGTDIGSGTNASKWEHGFATAVDAGARLSSHLAIGFQEQRLYGGRHGMLPLYGLVLRATF